MMNKAILKMNDQSIEFDLQANNLELVKFVLPTNIGLKFDDFIKAYKKAKR